MRNVSCSSVFPSEDSLLSSQSCPLPPRALPEGAFPLISLAGVQTSLGLCQMLPKKATRNQTLPNRCVLHTQLHISSDPIIHLTMHLDIQLYLAKEPNENSPKRHFLYFPSALAAKVITDIYLQVVNDVILINASRVTSNNSKNKPE